MMRILPLLALLALASCDSLREPATNNAGPVQGPTVSVGGSMHSYYGNVRQ
jgi:hypothetical protein